MNTSLTSSSSAQRNHRLAAPYIQCACLLMLASLALFSEHAVAQDAEVGKGAPMQGGGGLTKLVAPLVKTPDPVGVPPGTGPNPPILPPTPPKVVPPPVPAPAPPLAAPPPPKPVAIAPTPDGGVTPGAGPKPVPVSALPPKLDLAPASPATLSTSTFTPAPAPAAAFATDPGKTATQGAGSNTAEGPFPGAQGQGNTVALTPAASGAVASLPPTNAASSADIKEVLPSAQKLSESMREAPVTQTQITDKDAKVAVVNNKCIPVSFRPDSQRPELSLVDLTGDGLIISAVPNSHIQGVFTNAGYGQVDLSQAARWCITQTAVRALVRPSPSIAMQQAALLVQTGTSLQLMSKDQWLAYQASMTPMVTVMTPVTPSVAQPEIKAKAAKPSKPNKSG